MGLLSNGVAAAVESFSIRSLERAMVPSRGLPAGAGADGAASGAARADGEGAGADGADGADARVADCGVAALDADGGAGENGVAGTDATFAATSLERAMVDPIGFSGSSAAGAVTGAPASAGAAAGGALLDDFATNGVAGADAACAAACAERAKVDPIGLGASSWEG